MHIWIFMYFTQVWACVPYFRAYKFVLFLQLDFTLQRSYGIKMNQANKRTYCYSFRIKIPKNVVVSRRITNFYWKKL